MLLAVGVVYCQMHYAVDALAGTGLALVLVLALGPISRAHGPERRDERT